MSSMVMERWKVTFLGDFGVGKSAILTRGMYDDFDPSYQATVGIDFMTKSVFKNGRAIRLQLWDTAGQERFRSLVHSYIRDAAIAVIVYDVTSRSSFDHVDMWVNYVREQRSTDATVVLVGNKVDLGHKRLVSIQEAKTRAAALDALYVETSAKTGNGIKTLFESITKNIPAPSASPDLRWPYPAAAHKVFLRETADVHRPTSDTSCIPSC